MITRDMTPEQRKQYCESVIQDWKDSGLNVTAFCADRKIPKARFYRYRNVALGTEDKPGAENSSGGIPNLQERAEQDGIVLEVQGVKVHVGRETDVELACRVLRALQ